jgi:dipeptidyl aminopeptidase/acylaminoacyl peptidase
MDKLRRELVDLEIIRIPDSRHGSVFYTHRLQVVSAMRRFLGESNTSSR